ncbi:hypothetical protein ABT282_07500 [Streptomyces sp. NPDC000927]|uniref:hypothetical protein n=1 Tax=Streptomyces sp. NPDC000927 TaxID=3154371 RepID=UPI00331EF285
MTVETTGAPDQLAEIMVEMRARGETLARISAKVGLSVPICHERITAYLENMSLTMSVTQMRMLQLVRLEQIMPVLYEQAMDGDIATQGKNIKNLIDLIREITELMDLKKDRLRDEQVRLTQAQTEMILSSVDLMRVQMLGKVKETLASGGGFHAVESAWDAQFSEVAASAIEQNSAALIQLGPGSGPVQPTQIPN